MSNRKRKTTDTNEQPWKKRKYSPPANINNDEGPICPNLYSPPKKKHTTTRYPSQATGFSNTSDEDDDVTFNIPNHSPSPIQNHRKSIPDLRPSQDSFSSIPPSPERTDRTSSQRHQRGDVEQEIKRAAKEGKYIKTAKSNKQYTSKLIDIKNAYSEKGWFLILIGFVIGYLICYGVLHIMSIDINGSKQVDHQYIYIPNNGSCPCDIDNNKTCVECQGCMDKYWSLRQKYTDCKKKNDELQGKVDNEALKQCENKVNEMEDKLRKCRQTPCYEYKLKISNLSHDLGECNVEWGTCEQKGRQKDALDKLRLKKIEEEKQKFSLCNEQLKRYKEKAKKKKKT